MVQALVIKADRIRMGKGLQNIKYSSTFSNFCNLLASTSTRAYQTFRRYFGGRVMSSIRSVIYTLSPFHILIYSRTLRAKMPRFRPGISAHNVDLAAAVLKKYNYTGPFSLSWDDTELEPAISIYQESKSVCIVVGSVDGELRVESQDAIDRVFENAKLNKADKVCSSSMIHALYPDDVNYFSFVFGFLTFLFLKSLLSLRVLQRCQQPTRNAHQAG